MQDLIAGVNEPGRIETLLPPSGQSLVIVGPRWPAPMNASAAHDN